MDSLLDQVGCLAHLTGTEVLDDCFGLVVGGRSTLLRMNGFEHVTYVTDLCCRHMAEDIPVKMHHGVVEEVAVILAIANARPAWVAEVGRSGCLVG